MACFSLLCESETDFIEDMHGTCVTQFAKETGAERYFGDNSRTTQWMTLNSPTLLLDCS